MYILEADGVTYTREYMNCEGFSDLVIANNECIIMLDTLTTHPYSLDLNEEVWATV